MKSEKELYGSHANYKAIYKFSRLGFKADVIDQLDWDDKFCVVTPVGSFAMTKREFYEVFRNVVNSKSYQIDRVYHYHTVPQKAIPFKVA